MIACSFENGIQIDYLYPQRSQVRKLFGDSLEIAAKVIVGTVKLAAFFGKITGLVVPILMYADPSAHAAVKIRSVQGCLFSGFGRTAVESVGEYLIDDAFAKPLRHGKAAVIAGYLIILRKC